MEDLNILIPTAKMEANMALNMDGISKIVVLIAPGSLSPIHRMHVPAKEHVESKHKDFKVVAGFVSPSHDKYVLRKLKQEHITIDHRFAMCELATGEHKWITLSQWEGKQNNFSYWNIVMNVHLEYFKKKFPGASLQLMFVCGADLAVKSGGMYEGVCGFPVVIVGREEFTHHLVEGKRFYRHDANLIMNYLVTQELEPISSTEIRKRLKHGGNLETLMHPAAANYLREKIKYEIIENENLEDKDNQTKGKAHEPVIENREMSYLQLLWRCTIV